MRIVVLADTLRAELFDNATSAKFGEVSVKMRVYYSSYHLWSANHFTQLAKAIEVEHEGHPVFNIEHRAYVTNVVFMSVAFLEAAINEVFQDAADEHLAYIGALETKAIAEMKSFWKPKDRTSLLKKYQKVLEFSEIPKFDEGKPPYKRVRLLIDLRDTLVHYKPKTLGSKDTFAAFEEDLSKEFPINQLMIGAGNSFFPDKYLGYGCCNWAVEQSKGFADGFFSKIGVVPNYQRVKF